MIRLINYVELTWIKTHYWKPEAWSVFKKAIRTNNDCEGLHHIWNSRYCKNKLIFYSLVGNLFQVATLVPLNGKLLSHGKLKREQRKSAREHHERLHATWELISSKQLDAPDALNIFVSILCKRPIAENFDDGLEYDRYS